MVSLPYDEAGVNGESLTSFLRNRNKVGTSGREYLIRMLQVAERSKVKGYEVAEELVGTGQRRRGGKIVDCGSYLHFRHYVGLDDCRLLRANFCREYKLCVLCGARRGGRLVSSYLERMSEVLGSRANLRLWNLTLTVRDGPDLVERFSVLENAFGVLLDRSRDYRKKGRGASAFNVVHGGVRSFEVKRGKGSGVWHPHVHALLLVDGELDRERLLREWALLVGQDEGSTYAAHTNRGHGFKFCGPVGLRPRRGEVDASVIGAFLECFKYCVKFGDMPAMDIVSAWRVLRFRRLVQSWGVLWGVEVPDIADEALEGDYEWMDLFFRWCRGEYRLFEVDSSGTSESA